MQHRFDYAAIVRDACGFSRDEARVRPCPRPGAFYWIPHDAGPPQCPSRYLATRAPPSTTGAADLPPHWHAPVDFCDCGRYIGPIVGADSTPTTVSIYVFGHWLRLWTWHTEFRPPPGSRPRGPLQLGTLHLEEVPAARIEHAYPRVLPPVWLSAEAALHPVWGELGPYVIAGHYAQAPPPGFLTGAAWHRLSASHRLVWQAHPADVEHAPAWRSPPNSLALLDDVNWLLYPRLDFRPRRVRIHDPAAGYVARRRLDLHARVQIGMALRAWARSHRNRHTRRAMLLLPDYRLLPPALIDLPHLVHAVAAFLGPMDPAPPRNLPLP